MRQIADAEPRAPIHRQLGHVRAVDLDRALVGGNQARDHVEHGGLAGAVRPKQPDSLAAADIETDAADDGALLEALDHGADGEAADGRIGLGLGYDRLAAWVVPALAECLAAWKRQQFAHYPFRSFS